VAIVDEPIAENAGIIKQARASASKCWAGVVDFLTPPLCLGCQTPVTAGAALCLDCWHKLHFIDDPVCDVLGMPFAYDEGEGAISPAAMADPPHWNKARAAVAFNDASKHLVHLLKYQDTQEAGLAMARMMVGAGRTLLTEADLILPVPLHRKRLWQRRFNQAAFLTQAISTAVQKPWAYDVLLRIEATTSQVGLDAKERRKNVRGAFQVPPEKRCYIEGKTVVLVDDVRTTGATADTCAEILKQSGAAQVHVLSFALVLEPTRLHIEA
jgi:ComF family protein